VGATGGAHEPDAGPAAGQMIAILGSFD
jgi:hypothetical protein